MNVILGMADMLWESKLDTEQQQYVDVFRRAGSGLLTLINDILDLSKIEAGHLELERVEFDLEAVMHQAIELTAVKAQAKGIALLGHLAPNVPTCLIGDPGRLRQIFINLLGNAIKFTDSGEIVLSARSPRVRQIGPDHVCGLRHRDWNSARCAPNDFRRFQEGGCLHYTQVWRHRFGARNQLTLGPGDGRYFRSRQYGGPGEHVLL